GQLPALATTDCNGNSQSDAFDIVRGLAFDAYPYNNVPDSCEPDCNSNLVGDLTEIALDWQLDRDLSRTLDSCDINAAGGTGGFGGARDTNANGILDSFEGKPNVVITEIMYNPAGADEGQEWVEIYNAGAAPVDVSGWALKDVEGDPATGGITPGTVLQPQEAIVLVPGSGPGVPAEIVSQFRTAWSLPANVRILALTPWQDRAQQATDIDEVLGLIDASGQIVDVVNYQNREYVATSAWPDDDGDSSIAIRSNAVSKSANDIASNWTLSMSGLDGARDSAQFGIFNDGRLTGSVGSPGVVWTQAPQHASGEVIFTELMFSPNSNPGDATRGEWVELYNTTEVTVDLSGWYLRDEDGRTSSIPAGTSLAPHAAIVLTPRGGSSAAAAEAEFRAAWGQICQVIALTGWSDQETLPNLGGLANSPSLGNELLTLRTSAGGLVDVVNFDDTLPWPADAAIAAPGLGAAWSIYLRPGLYDANANDDGGNWSPSSIGVDLAQINLLTPVYNGIDIASPGLIAGQVLTPSCATVACDDIDFNNNDVFPEDQDVIDFFNVLAGADCPNCNDIDFNNNNVFPEDQDVIDFFNVLAGGNCN
ncbi:MAG TPA: lamin tail domain-containing protein, partial [Phycisphaerales bacterium]|nr:lamin tail domain-containing protein [Phycisphaerales bacterium]